MNIKENFHIHIRIQGGSYFSRWFTALRFTATVALLAARCIQILPMNQYACGQ
jgi:hypothetical protein